MPALNPPAVFVSSTCYDLSQIRRDLMQFIEGMGFEPVLSEFSSFPVDPSGTTIDTCRRAVREKADLFVLIVGSRYGSMDDYGRSITNLEYLEARATGIPVYVFVLKEILSLLDIWKDNPNGKFAKVDSPQLFEFVASLRDAGKLWVFPFERAADIETALRTQWAHLFNDALRVWRQIRTVEDSELYKGRSPEILRLLIDRPFAWEYRLFSRALTEGMAQYQPLKRDWQLRLGPSDPMVVRYDDFMEWMQAQMANAERLVEGVTSLMNDEFAKATGHRGGDPDPERVLYVAGRIAASFGHMLEWSMVFNNVHADVDFRGVLGAASQFLVAVIEKIEHLEEQLRKELRDLVVNPPGEAENRQISVMVDFEIPQDVEDRFHAEMRRLETRFGVN